ncbi:MAG: UvrB/UvrC motif-containing protein [Acidobacteria bacterium]|nr:UvrB/UvrC motif-containing protein [Acidobacteriota bacterium]
MPFDPARDEEFFSSLPTRAAVFAIELHEPLAEPYLVRTADLRHRLERLLRLPVSPSQRLNLREVTARVRYRLTGSPFEQGLVLYQQARLLFPNRYRDLLRLRPAALLKINLAHEYPRCYVTRRILADGGFYFGPFLSRRMAENVLNAFLDLFKLRRCQIKIRRDPAFPGCIYSEMKMCLAPCFAGCSKAEYDVETTRVVGFLDSSGASLKSEWERERNLASEALDFEQAARVQRRVEKLEGVISNLPKFPRRLDELDAVILQRAAAARAIAVFTVRSGLICEPFILNFDQFSGNPQSVEAILRRHLESQASGVPAEAMAASTKAAPLSVVCSSEVLADHLALLAHWYYGKPRSGEIFFPHSGRASSSAAAGTLWPYRRIMRACTRLLVPEAL